MSDDETITIIGTDDREGDDRDDQISSTLAKGDVEVKRLRERLDRFLRTMAGVLRDLPGNLGGFSVDSLEVTVEVSAEGSVGLLGTGAQIGGKGGLTFTLKKADAALLPPGQTPQPDGAGHP